MYPSASVVTAMFESYLSMRKAAWNLTDENGKLIAPEKDSDAAHKIDTCKTLLQSMHNHFFVTSDWISLTNDLFKMEKDEQKYLDNLWAIRRWFGSRLLLETLKAVRSYVLTELQNDNVQYSEHNKQLEKTKNDTGMLFTSKSNLKEAHKPEEILSAAKNFEAATEALKPFDLGAIKYDKQDHLHYFKTYILKNDPQAKAEVLNEKSFADFAKHAITLKRSTDLCLKLVRSKSSLEASTFTNKNIPISIQHSKTTQHNDIQSLEEAAAKSSNPVVNKAPRPRRSNRIKAQDSNPTPDSKSASTQSALRANSAIQSASTKSRGRSRASYAEMGDSQTSSSPYRKY